MKWWHFISIRLNLHGDIMFYRKKTLAIIWPIDSGMISFNTGRIIKWHKCIQGNESFFRMVLAGEVSLPLMRVSQKSSACLIRVSFLAENNQRAAPSERLRRILLFDTAPSPFIPRSHISTLTIFLMPLCQHRNFLKAICSVSPWRVLQYFVHGPFLSCTAWRWITISFSLLHLACVADHGSLSICFL